MELVIADVRSDATMDLFADDDTGILTDVGIHARVLEIRSTLVLYTHTW